MTRHRYGSFAVVPQTSFRGETISQASSNVGGSFPGWVLPYINDISMCQGMVFAPFWSGIDFVHFGLESRVWFARKLRECLNTFTVSKSNE